MIVFDIGSNISKTTIQSSYPIAAIHSYIASRGENDLSLRQLAPLEKCMENTELHKQLFPIKSDQGINDYILIKYWILNGIANYTNDLSDTIMIPLNNVSLGSYSIQKDFTDGLSSTMHTTLDSYIKSTSSSNSSVIYNTTSLQTDDKNITPHSDKNVDITLYNSSHMPYQTLNIDRMFRYGDKTAGMKEGDPVQGESIIAIQSPPSTPKPTTLPRGSKLLKLKQKYDKYKQQNEILKPVLSRAVKNRPKLKDDKSEPISGSGMAVLISIAAALGLAAVLILGFVIAEMPCRRGEFFKGARVVPFSE